MTKANLLNLYLLSELFLMEGLSRWLQQVQVTPPAPLSPLSQSELGKQHLQGEGRPDDAALNSSSGARGSHISCNTSWVKCGEGEAPGQLQENMAHCSPGQLMVSLHCHCTGRAVGKVTHMDPNTGQQKHRQWFAWQKFGKAQVFPAGKCGSFPLLPLRHPHLGGEQRVVA